MAATAEMIPTTALAPAGLESTDLRARIRRAGRRRVMVSWFLMAPGLIFLAAVFLVPIIAFMVRSIDNREVVHALPRTVAALDDWDRQGLPRPDAFAALIADLGDLDDPGAGALGRRLNYNLAGLRTLIVKTRNAVLEHDGGDPVDTLTGIDRRWGEPVLWGILKNESGPVTPFYLLASVDLDRDWRGDIVRTPEERAIYTEVLVRTVWISAGVTFLCILLGFPVAYVLAEAPAHLRNRLLILVLMPFWISVLVRTTAWVILLQQEGPVNRALEWLGLIEQPIPLIFNRIGVYIAMCQVLMPFFILPLYSVMTRIPREHLRAAASLGAAPPTVFWRIYLPQAMPGVGAGALLVFVTSLGYYITPILVGGPGDQMISYFVAFFTNESVNWGMAAALGSLLLLLVLALYFALGRVVGIDRMRIS